jgi:hypothetical protein
MVAWYKHDIPAWMNGTENLDADCYRVYHVICQLIYLNEGPIARNEQGIAGRCKMHVLRLRKCIDQLITLGKLTINPDLTLDQPRANLELRKIGSNRVNAGLGGSAPRKSLKANDQSEAPLQQDRSLKTREEETREEDKHCPDAKAPRTKYSDEFEAKFWQPYPRTPTMSKSEAWKAWMKMTLEQRVTACQAIEPYKRHLRSKPNLETVHACRFLSQERYAGFSSGAAGQSQTFDIRSHLV